MGTRMNPAATGLPSSSLRSGRRRWNTTELSDLSEQQMSNGSRRLYGGEENQQRVGGDLSGHAERERNREWASGEGARGIGALSPPGRRR